MDFATYKRDVWGREVILGASWDLLWVVVVLAFVFIAVHAIVMAARKREERPSSEGTQVPRHAGVDRAFHWIMAVSVFALMITGLVLTAVVAFHILRSFTQDFLSIWITPKDLGELTDSVKPGKYSLAQKSMHLAVTVLTLLVIGSGIVMFSMIDTPWWERTNSIPESTLGWVFLIHGLSTLALIGVVSLHVYFSLRPEKLFYTRSMVKGWISEHELRANHDPEQWSPKESA